MMMDLCEMHNLKKLKREGDLQYISLKSIFLLQLSFRYFNRYFNFNIIY